MQANKPILIVGLGNPGTEYLRTRHNVGFMAVQSLAGPDAIWRAGHRSKFSIQTRGGCRIIFAMPQTFMNLSGEAVQSLMTYYKIPLENLIVIHDDMDLPNGKMRDKIGGGSAGHNGIKSIDAMVGRDFRRIRIGIDHPRNLQLSVDPSDWVLGKFTDEQMSQIDAVISTLGEILKL